MMSKLSRVIFVTCLFCLEFARFSVFQDTKQEGFCSENKSIKCCENKSNEEMAAPKLKSLNFEVFGIVQGVFFRKHTEKAAKKLGLRGWCMNTHEGTVKGQLEGPADGVEEMKKWLKFTGSPSSRIDKAVFSEEKEIPKFTFNEFKIER